LKHIETTFIIWESTPQISMGFRALVSTGFFRGPFAQANWGAALFALLVTKDTNPQIKIWMFP
jgi:hypothetical protein